MWGEKRGQGSSGPLNGYLVEQCYTQNVRNSIDGTTVLRCTVPVGNLRLASVAIFCLHPLSAHSAQPESSPPFVFDYSFHHTSQIAPPRKHMYRMTTRHTMARPVYLPPTFYTTRPVTVLPCLCRKILTNTLDYRHRSHFLTPYSGPRKIDLSMIRSAHYCEQPTLACGTTARVFHHLSPHPPRAFVNGLESPLPTPLPGSFVVVQSPTPGSCSCFVWFPSLEHSHILQFARGTLFEMFGRPYPSSMSVLLRRTALDVRQPVQSWISTAFSMPSMSSKLTPPAPSLPLSFHFFSSPITFEPRSVPGTSK